MDKQIAYVGTYTNGGSLGIHIYDIDSETGFFTERTTVPVNNPSDIVISDDGKYLYSIADIGVQAFAIEENGDLTELNAGRTGALRGTHLEVDKEGRYLLVAGYHDGSVSLVHLNEDGSIGEIGDNIFHKSSGKGLVALNENAAHVTGVTMLPDESGICAADAGLDQVCIYDIDRGRLKLREILRVPLDCAPRIMQFDQSGRFAYLLCETANMVIVYRLDHDAAGRLVFEEIQKIETIDKKEMDRSASVAMRFTPDGAHLFVAVAGVNRMTILNVDPETGMLSFLCCNSTGGFYPKALAVLPDGRHVAVLLHDTDNIMVFAANYEKGYFLMDQKPISIDQPNCIKIHMIRE